MVYVGHIPHGFYEEEMKKYFSQFGTVKRLKLSRSKKVSVQAAFVKGSYGVVVCFSEVYLCFVL